MPTVFNKDLAVDVPNKFKLKTTPSLHLKWLLSPISRSSNESLLACHLSIPPPVLDKIGITFKTII